MRKRKFKNGERSLWSHLGVVVLSLGIGTLAVISIGATWVWWSSQPAPGGTTPPFIDINQSVQASVSVPVQSFPEDARLMVSTRDGKIMSNKSSGGDFSATGQYGNEISTSPDGKTVAYLDQNQLFIAGQDNQISITVSEQARMLAWSADGHFVTFVESGTEGDIVYKVSLGAGKRPVLLITVPKLVAPPISNPATGRLLIVEGDGPSSSFYTISSDCSSPEGCRATRRDIAMINDVVTWADYHPNAASIAFSDAGGNLYLLETGNGSVQSILINSDHKDRPRFSKDGAWLAYIDITQNSELRLMQLDKQQETFTGLGDVASFSWLP